MCETHDIGMIETLEIDISSAGPRLRSLARGLVR
jgi:hypothetical protein